MQVAKLKYSQPGLMVLLASILLTAPADFMYAQNSASNNSSSILVEYSSEGPSWVKSELIKNRVLETPGFKFTDDFDAEKSESNIRGLFFKGLPYHGKPTKVFCWYGIPENLSKDDKVPAVVLVHGGGGTAYNQWVKEWTQRGYIAISIALEGQLPGDKIEGDDGQKQYRTFQFSGPKRQGFFEDVVTENLENQWFYHAVSDIMMATSLLKSLPNVDKNKIGITGISWGGILTNVVTGLDDRFAFSIPVYGCGFLQETPHYHSQLSKLSKEQQAFYLNNWEPSLYVPLQKQPTLFVNGTNDFHFTMNSFTKTYEVSPNEKYLYVEHYMKHGHLPGWAPKTIYAFADYVVKKGTPPTKTEFIKRNKSKVLYEYQGDVNKVFLYYTTKTADWGSDNYKWIQYLARLSDDKKTISASLPKNAVAYFINTINSEGIMYSSPMKMVAHNMP